MWPLEPRPCKRGRLFLCQKRSPGREPRLRSYTRDSGRDDDIKEGRRRLASRLNGPKMLAHPKRTPPSRYWEALGGAQYALLRTGLKEGREDNGCPASLFPRRARAEEQTSQGLNVEAQQGGADEVLGLHRTTDQGARPPSMSSCIGFGSSPFGACVRARIGSLLPALVAFAAAFRDDAGQIISAVVVGNLGTCSDVLDCAYDDLVAYRVGLGIGSARVVCVASEVLSARSVNRPTAVDFIKIAVASRLKFIRLLARHLAPFVFDNEGSPLNLRSREKAQASAGTTDTESSLAGHITHLRRFAPVNHLGAGAPVAPQDIGDQPIAVVLRLGRRFWSSKPQAATAQSVAVLAV